ncbi:MAG: hypothetical protein PWP23_425 [Candidatus Sumerlaeota bacterium]|nr:hypothetical protein [Candidatus Sumerlaeota bacterium]
MKTNRRFWALCAMMLCLGLLTTAARGLEIVVDNDASAPGFNQLPYVETGSWRTSSTTGYNGGIYRYCRGNESAATATWTPTITAEGTYEVATVFRAGSNRPTAARYTITHADGVSTVTVDMTGNAMTEVSLGEFRFNTGTTGSVMLDNSHGDYTAVISDAIIFRSTGVISGPDVGQPVFFPSQPTEQDIVTVQVAIRQDRGFTGVRLQYLALPSGLSGSVEAYDDGQSGDGLAGDDIWAAALPSFAAGQTVSCWFVATDADGHETSGTPQSVPILDSSFVPREYRAVWADSWNTSFLNASQAETLIQTLRDANMNVVVPEVRKIGDAYYNSSIEPRATNISGGSTFDPLQTLIDLAHDTTGGKRRVEVHAWFVMHRISKSETLAPTHVLSQHPEYQMSNSLGELTASGNKYLDPGHPGAVDHNIAVILDCMRNYDIDGVNLDYIRYPEYSGEWGYNPVSVARFNAFTGKTGQPDGSDPDWDAWRRECVTLEVKKLYVQMKKLRPEVVLTADTVNWGYDYDDYESSSAYAGVFQDWRGWLQEGILDYNMLMNYTTDSSVGGRLQGWTQLSLDNDEIRGSIIGIGAYLQSSVQASVNQLLYIRGAGAEGMCIYDWGSEANAAGATQAQFYDAVRQQVFPDWAEPPVATWITNPTKGIIEGTIIENGAPADHAVVQVAGLPAKRTHSDGSGWYGILELTPGPVTLEVTGPGGASKTVVVNLPAAGDIVTVDIDLSAAPVVDNDGLLVY